MKCPYCRSDTSEVFNSRSTKYGNQIWRRRRCLACRKTFTTYEAVDLGFLSIAADGDDRKRKQQPLQRYSRAKLFASIARAFRDGTGNHSAIDAITDTAEAKLLDLQVTEVDRDQIIAIVLQTLKPLDTGAFVRYLGTHAPPSTPAALRRELKKY